jgi:hypothetical protein
MEPEPLPDLVRYLIDRDLRRAEGVESFLASLTDRERSLVREAATVGHKLGTTYPRGARVPADSTVYADVRANSSWRTDGAPSPREQWLLREVAVMAFVRGSINRETLPDDQAVAHVVACCQSMPDRCPIVSRRIDKLTLKVVRLYPGAHADPVTDTVATVGAWSVAEARAALLELIADERVLRVPGGFVRMAES